MPPVAHRDPHFHSLFVLWGATHLKLPTTAAQKLFPALETFERFIQLAFPGSSPVADSGPHATVTSLIGHQRVSVLAVLNELGAWHVNREELPAAAYLCYESNHLRNMNRGHVLGEPGANEKSARFAQQHVNIPTADLRTMYDAVNWRDGDASRWMRAGYRSGISATDLAYFISGAVGRANIALWEPEKVAELLDSGVSREYLREFWGTPGWFYKTWEAGLPLEYAIVTVAAEREARKAKR